MIWYDDEYLQRELKQESLHQLPREIETAWDTEVRRFKRFQSRLTKILLITALIILLLLAGAILG
jgi:hypothetical protein